ncbi:hypothetical protein HDV05_005635 [Chytridiales sp. JEL 0842]|nr:hypothetical protein HDV05_005635 [Chytridiales sp. JEL 0842]
MRRLQVYRETFEKVIEEFKLYGPILSKIKDFYDETIESFDLDDKELEELRSTVRSLLEKNENRLLLKYERKRSIKLERQLDFMISENERLKAELKEKLTLYAKHLPPDVQERVKKDRDESNLYAVDEDPITMYENRIGQLKDEIAQKSEQMTALQQELETDYVPKELKEKTEQVLKEAESEYETLQNRHQFLRQDLAAKQSLAAKLEHSIREKEEQYQFLIGEYTQLTESLNQSKKGESAS